MRTFLLAVGLWAALPPGSLSAQATRDQARLVFNIAAGYVGGRDLWRVTDQPLYDDRFGGDVLIDTVTLTRSVRPTLSLGLKGIYFRGDHFGLFGEAYLLGLGFHDGCTRTYATVSARNAEVCASVDDAEESASAVQLSGGAIYRLSSRKVISPYGRVGIGVAVSNRNSVSMTGAFRSPASDNQLVEVEIYSDQTRTRVTGALTLGFGMTALLAPGYQIRWEIRDNMVGIRSVTGPTVQDGIAPPTSLRYRHLLGIEVGFDVVLERRRGRRY